MDLGELGIVFIRSAVTIHNTKKVKLQKCGDGSYISSTGVEVANLTIQDILHVFFDKFDLVKLDCEGSEFPSPENWPGRVATQISVEFHDYVDRTIFNQVYFEKLFSGPLKDYHPVLFKETEMGPGKTLGHWDSLLICSGKS